MKIGGERMLQELLTSSPETVIHDFRDNFNYFDVLESAAEALIAEEPCQPYEMQAALKQRLTDMEY